MRDRRSWRVVIGVRIEGCRSDMLVVVWMYLLYAASMER
jgi:hypothetical protein